MNARSSSSAVRYEALLQLLRTADTLWNTSRVFFARWKISPSQFNILNLLSSEPEGLSQIDLGRLLITHRSNVTGLVNRLEKRHLVLRKNAPRDRRAYRVVLTSEGRSLLGEILPHYFEIADKVWGGFSPARASKLAADLKRLQIRAERLIDTE